MRKLIILVILAISLNLKSYSQYSTVPVNSSYKYIASPGFVNITEFTGATGIRETTGSKSKYYFGVTNVFGYQVNRNFFGGIGVGFYSYESGLLFPLFLEYKYSIYLKDFTPFLFSDGGALLDPADLYQESKIFINPGIGISRAVSNKLEGTFSLGVMVQAGPTMIRSSFVNVKLGIIFRKNSFRLFKPQHSYSNS